MTLDRIFSRSASIAARRAATADKSIVLDDSLALKAFKLLKEAEAKSRTLLFELVVSAVKLGITSPNFKIFGLFFRFTDKN